MRSVTTLAMRSVNHIIHAARTTHASRSGTTLITLTWTALGVRSGAQLHMRSGTTPVMLSQITQDLRPVTTLAMRSGTTIHVVREHTSYAVPDHTRYADHCSPDGGRRGLSTALTARRKFCFVWTTSW